MSRVRMRDRAHALEGEYFLRQEKKLIQKLQEKLAAEAAEATIHACPKCHGKLVESTFENIVIEVCNNCHGVWLDADDLEQIAHHEEHHGSWFARWFE